MMELGNLLFGNSRGTHPVNRDWQESFVEFLDESGFDNYGNWYGEKLKAFEKREAVDGCEDIYFENDLFVIRPYYWGESQVIREKPNFVFKPTGLEIQWYKYPFRDAYLNQEVSFSEFEDMVKQCRESLLKGE